MSVVSAVVTLAGADITNLCRDELVVRFRERESARAEFRYSPDTAPLYPAAMIRSSVVITLDGTVVFTGEVDAARWIPQDRVYEIEASNFLQERFEGKTNAEILALLPGALYSTARFGDREDGWQYALDAMSTIQSDVHVDAAGALQVTAWAAKGTPDRVLGPDCGVRDNNAYRLFLSTARDLHNQHLIKYEYRVSRWKVRTHGFGWTFTNSAVSDWCDWAQNYGFDMPTRDVVRQAAEGTNWPISQGIAYQTHPESGLYCGGALGWGTTDEAQAQVVISASWSGIRKWAQTITETYEITLDAQGSQSAYGSITVHEDGASRDIEADDSAYENTSNTDWPSGWATDSLGDGFQDQEDEPTRQNDLATVLAIGEAQLLDLHRRNRLTVDVDLIKEMDLSETVEIDLPTVKGRGKVAEYEHRYDGLHGRTIVTIAISRGGGVGDPISVPARPDTSPSHTAPPTDTNLQTNIGGCDDSPDYDPAWNGWNTNRDPATCPGSPGTGAKIYPYEFKVKGPDIETESRNEVKATSQTLYRIAIPEDYLVIT